jgi:hypothetical protein
MAKAVPRSSLSVVRCCEADISLRCLARDLIGRTLETLATDNTIGFGR